MFKFLIEIRILNILAIGKPCIIFNFEQKTMKKLLYIITIIGLVSCTGKPKKGETPVPDKQTCITIADSLINLGEETDKIWNLQNLDYESMAIFQDNFSSKDRKDFLICFSGDAGMSAGTMNCLLMKLSWDEAGNRWQTDWFAQEGEVDSASIMDLNGDGIKELKIESGMMWMGECFENIHIFNLVNNVENTIYLGQSHTIVDCGGENYSETYAPGDTVETIRSIEIRDKEIIETVTYKICNGGQTDEEIISNLKEAKQNNVIKL